MFNAESGYFVVQFIIENEHSPGKSLNILLAMKHSEPLVHESYQVDNIISYKNEVLEAAPASLELWELMMHVCLNFEAENMDASLLLYQAAGGLGR